MSELVEEWKWIIGYEDYQFSNLGRVKSFKYGKERILKNSLSSTGYLFINLCKNGNIKRFLIHQLVCQAFLGHVIDGHTMVVNHINGIRTDNRVENLEIVTQRDNCSTCARKDRDTMSSPLSGVSWNKKSNKWKSDIYYNGKDYYLGLFIIEEEAYKQSKIALSHINNGTFEEYYYELINKLKNKFNNDKKIKVLQYTKSGEFIREWDSATEASRELNINQGDICACCRGKLKSAGGFIWKYKE